MNIINMVMEINLYDFLQEYKGKNIRLLKFIYDYRVSRIKIEHVKDNIYYFLLHADKGYVCSYDIIIDKLEFILYYMWQPSCLAFDIYEPDTLENDEKEGFFQRIIFDNDTYFECVFEVDGNKIKTGSGYECQYKEWIEILHPKCCQCGNKADIGLGNPPEEEIKYYCSGCEDILLSHGKMDVP